MKVNGRYLRSLREKRGYTLRQFAQTIGLSPSYLSQIENNQKTPSVKILQKLAEALNLGKEQLITLTEPTPGISLAKKLKALRQQQGLSLEELAQKTEINPDYLSKIEEGDFYPPFEIINKLAQALRVKSSALFAAENNFAEKFRLLRLEHQLTLEELANRMGVSEGLLWQLEQGRIQPSLKTLEKVSAVLGMDACLFLLEDDLNNKNYSEASIQNIIKKPQILELLQLLHDIDNQTLKVIVELVKTYKTSLPTRLRD